MMSYLNKTIDNDLSKGIRGRLLRCQQCGYPYNYETSRKVRCRTRALVGQRLRERWVYVLVLVMLMLMCLGAIAVANVCIFGLGTLNKDGIQDTNLNTVVFAIITMVLVTFTLILAIDLVFRVFVSGFSFVHWIGNKLDDPNDASTANSENRIQG